MFKNSQFSNNHFRSGSDPGRFCQSGGKAAMRASVRIWFKMGRHMAQM
jgi:hypothetical protein